MPYGISRGLLTACHAKISRSAAESSTKAPATWESTPGSAKRGYHLAMLYFKAPGRFLVKGSPAAEWGRFVSYIEVADDQQASRQVNVFQNGNVLHYDRSHCKDAFARLTGIKFSKKPKWRHFYPGVEMLTASEFEAVWREAVPPAEIR